MYDRPVRKKRSAFFDNPGWVEVFERGKLPRPDLEVKGDFHYPPVDVHDVLLQAGLNDLRRRLEVLCVALLKPSANGPLSGPSSATVEQGKMLADYSSIWEFLTGTSWSDGTSRKPGSLSLKLMSGSLQATLTDPSTATYCCRSGRSLEECLMSLEMAFLDNSLAWRASEYAKPKK